MRCGHRVNRNGGGLRGAYILQDAASHPRQIDLHPAGIGRAFLGAAHAAHHGVDDAWLHLGIHHHLGEEIAARVVGRGTPVHRHLDVARRHTGQREVAVGVGKDRLALQAHDPDPGVRNRQLEDVVGRMDHTVRPTPDVVEGHR